MNHQNNPIMPTINEALPTINGLANDQLTRFHILTTPVLVWRQSERFEFNLERSTGREYKVFVASFLGVNTFVLCEPWRTINFLGREIASRLRVVICQSDEFDLSE